MNFTDPQSIARFLDEVEASLANVKDSLPLFADSSEGIGSTKGQVIVHKVCNQDFADYLVAATNAAPVLVSLARRLMGENAKLNETLIEALKHRGGSITYEKKEQT